MTSGPGGGNYDTVPSHILLAEWSSEAPGRPLLQLHNDNKSNHEAKTTTKTKATNGSTDTMQLNATQCNAMQRQRNANATPTQRQRNANQHQLDSSNNNTINARNNDVKSSEQRQQQQLAGNVNATSLKNVSSAALERNAMHCQQRQTSTQP